MSLLAPLFLAGLLAVAMPLWLHRLQTQSADRKPFSSAMLLETTEQRVHVRRKLAYLGLLALRITVLALVALAFARPIWTAPGTAPVAAPDGTHLVLVDTSASMSRGDVFDQAQTLARRAVASAPRGALLQVLAASGTVREASPLTLDRDPHVAAVMALEPDAARLDFGRAMAAVDRVAQGVPAPVTLHVVSDLQDSAMPVRFADLVASHVAELQIHGTAAAGARNWSIESLRAAPDGINVVVAGEDDAADRVPVTLTLNGVQVGEKQAAGPGISTLNFAALPLEPGDNRLQASIERQDDFGLDNTYYQVVANEPPAPIPLLTADRGGLPVTYLSAALHADPAGRYRVEPTVIGEFDTRTLQRYRWLIVDDIGSVGPALGTALRDFVAAGGGVLAFAGRRSATLPALPLLDNAVAGASLGGNRNVFLTPGQVDGGHPVLTNTDGWHAVNVSQTVPVATSMADDVLVRLDNGEPFIMERRIDRGRVLLVLGGLENQWNDLPLRPVFVSFVIEAARYLSGTEPFERAFAAGAELAIPQSGAAAGQVVDPDGRSLLSLADTARARRVVLDKIGFYEVYTSDAEHLVAVNTDPRESDFAVMPAATVERWSASMGGDASAAGELVAPQRTEPIELWHVLLFILVLALIGESMLANVYLAPGTSGGST